MNVRVIAGKYGKRILDAPSGMTTHPMGERMKGSLFNIIGHRIKRATVLDAFAGTGALGIEALSRGATSAWFVERDKLAFTILMKNLELLGIEDEATTSRAALGAWVKTQRRQKFDIIFADPPYNLPQEVLVEKLAGNLEEHGMLIMSRATRAELRMPRLELVESRNYGEATLDFYKLAKK